MKYNKRNEQIIKLRSEGLSIREIEKRIAEMGFRSIKKSQIHRIILTYATGQNRNGNRKARSEKKN